MIHFRKLPEQRIIKHKNTVVVNYPPINKKVCKEVAFGSGFSVERVEEVMDCWNLFVDDSIENTTKVKLPYVGSLQPINKLRERNPYKQDKINYDNFEEI